MAAKTKVAVIGSGNIGTDLMIKIMRRSKDLEVAAMVGIDPTSDGLARAARLGVSTTSEGIDGLLRLPQFDEIGVVFDATSAAAHLEHEKALRPFGKLVIDLTPAALGPYVVPSVNLDGKISASNINMVTCGGQATIPIVAAISAVAPVPYAEIVASVSSRSAGPGTRANIDEFTETTAKAIVDVGGAMRGKAIIVLNPAEPPMIMRDTIYCLAQSDDRDAIRQSVEQMVERVQTYVPGYRLKQQVQFENVGDNAALSIPGIEEGLRGLKVSVFLEVEGAGHYLPVYAGNLDIMTSAAIKTAEAVLASRQRDKVN